MEYQLSIYQNRDQVQEKNKDIQIEQNKQQYQEKQNLILKEYYVSENQNGDQELKIIDLDKNLEDKYSLIQGIIQTSQNRSNQYYGKYKVYYFKNGVPLIAIGPHWPFLVFLMIFIGYFNHQTLSQLDYLGYKYHQLLIKLIWISQSISHLFVALKNPGIITSKQCDSYQELQKNQRFCDICKTIQNIDDDHCSLCNVCITNLDHHCVWTGKCIGKGNLVSFYVFLVLTSIQMAVLLFAAVFNFQNQLKI